jgi:hypothetical protein
LPRSKFTDLSTLKSDKICVETNSEPMRETFFSFAIVKLKIYKFVTRKGQAPPWYTRNSTAAATHLTAAPSGMSLALRMTWVTQPATTRESQPSRSGILRHCWQFFVLLMSISDGTGECRWYDLQLKNTVLQIRTCLVGSGCWP